MAILKTKRNPYLICKSQLKKKENAFLVACSVPIPPPHPLAKLKICHKGGGN